MLDKYIEDRFPKWFSMCLGNQDISDCNRVQFALAFSQLSSDIICKEHNIVIDFITKMANAWEESDPESFKNFWYNKAGITQR